MIASDKCKRAYLLQFVTLSVVVISLGCCCVCTFVNMLRLLNAEDCEVAEVEESVESS